MKKNRILALLILPILIIAVAGFALRRAASMTSETPTARSSRLPATPFPSSNGFAVVELFTSEGCSSCPPADRVLAELAGEFPEGVYVLGFHVDYWNRLGWKDIYSDAGYTDRQREYAQAFRLESIYTPEAVVNGHKEMVGSEQRQLQASVKAELAATVNRSLGLVATAAGKKVDLRYETKAAGVLHAALVQLSASSQVLDGENKGLRLTHINVVRDFASADLKKSGDGSLGGHLVLTLPEGLTAKDCKVIAYVQDPSLRITAAESVAIK